MLENLHFTYDGKSSKDFGVVLVNPSGGLYKEQFLPNRKIVETTVAGRRNPFFQRVDDDPLSFSLHIYLKDWKERNNLRQISRWLYQDYYKPLIFESNPDVIYYAMIEGKSELTHNGLFQGYISLTVRLNSPYCYSTPKIEEYKITSWKDVPIYNNGDLPMRVSFELKKNESGGDILIEPSNSDIGFAITWLHLNEIAYIDGDTETVISSLEENGRYLEDLHNGNWIEVDPEESINIRFHGRYDVKMKYQYVYLNTDIELIGKAGGNC